MECHLRRASGVAESVPAQIVLEVIIPDSRKSLSSEMVAFMPVEQLIELFQQCLEDLKISLFKVVLLEMMRRMGDVDEEGEPKEMLSPPKSPENKLAPPDAAPADTKDPKESDRRSTWGGRNSRKRTPEEEAEATILADYIKSVQGELRGLPDVVFAWVLTLLYTVVEFVSEDEEQDVQAECEEYFTFVLRGFQVKSTSPFFTPIFTSACDLFMVLCFIGCESGAVLEGPAFETICQQAKDPVSGSLQVAASATECLVVICRTDKGIDMLLVEKQAWCEWIGHALLALKEETETDWIYSMTVTALFRLWSIFAHESEECQTYFKDNLEKLPLEFIIRTYDRETFDRDCEADLDLITSACSAIVGIVAADKVIGADLYSAELEKILLDLLVYCYDDPDTMDQVCHCLSVIASKALIQKDGSAMLESILRAVHNHRDHPRFVTNALHSLSIFLRTDPSLQDILNYEALHLIISTMKENPFNEILQENGLFLVGFLSRRVEKNRRHLVECGAVQLCRIAEGQFPENTIISEHSKYAMSSLQKEPGFFQSLWG